MVDMLQLAARGVDELCARLVKGERERCKLQDATTKTLLRTKVRVRARALLRMQLCTSVLLRSVVDLVPCRSHQLALLLSFTAMLGLRKLQRVIGAPDAARGADYPPPECHHHTGLQEDTEGASRVAHALW